MTTREDIWDRLDQAHALPYGPARSALVAEAVTWADAIEDEEAAVVTRLELIHAYQWGREHWKGVAPFVWCLARQAERPDLFHHNRLYHLMWNYKWVVTAAAANPRVSLEQVRLLEDGMESFFRSQGASMHTVHGQRYYVAVDLGLPDEARAELEGMSEQAAEVLSQRYNIYAMLLFICSRFLCTYLMKFFRPPKLLAIFAVGGMIFTMGVIFLQNLPKIGRASCRERV